MEKVNNDYLDWWNYQIMTREELSDYGWPDDYIQTAIDEGYSRDIVDPVTYDIITIFDAKTIKCWEATWERRQIKCNLILVRASELGHPLTLETAAIVAQLIDDPPYGEDLMHENFSEFDLLNRKSIFPKKRLKKPRKKSKKRLVK